MSFDLLTPEAAALGILVALPLGALVAASLRAGRARSVLGLPAAGPRSVGAPVALLACAGLLTLAAAQPILTQRQSIPARTDAEAVVVVDSSRSMLAAADPGGETRFDRARAATSRVAEALPDVPLGLASMTDRVLPHVFPTARRQVFHSALDRVLAVEQPPPGARDVQITSLEALAEVARGDLFSPGSERRLMFVLTDGESRPFSHTGLQRALANAEIETVLVHVWQPGENVFGPDGDSELAYVPDAASAQVIAGLGDVLGGGFAEDDLDAAIQSSQDYLGSGPVENVGREVGAVHLAPWAIVAALLPLAFLLWRRNRA
ncbi:MAG: VWA domain-containing protein [Propionibacteriales bacterium]|nr:VWA domain-containing protein [Propionibacteriales bacterium]